MIKLKDILSEADSNPDQLAQPVFKEFAKHTGYSLAFKYLGLKNKQHIFAAPIEQIGMMDMIISKAEIVAMIDEQKAYFGLVYLLNGLEQFDATVCLIRKSSDGYAIKPFDDGDSDFANSKTDFIGVIESRSSKQYVVQK